MSVEGPYRVESAKQFPFGLVLVGGIEKKLEYDPDRKAEDRRQDRHKETGLPLWSCSVIDLDPESNVKTFDVTIVAEVQPVAPGLAANAPARLVQLEGLEITARTKVTGKNWKTKQDITRVVYYVTATGISAVKAAGAEGPKAA
jgi:hypothetical protein